MADRSELIKFSENDADDANSLYMNEITKNAYCSGAIELRGFVQSKLINSCTQKGDSNTNFVDLSVKKCYNLDSRTFNDLSRILDKCRREEVPNHWTEKQYSPTITHSGIMIDFDILTTSPEVALSDHQGMCLISIVASKLQADLKIDKGIIKHHAFIITKKAPKFKRTEGAKSIYKYGFHILIPSVWVTKAYKKWLFKELSSHPVVLGIIQQLNPLESEQGKCLDMNSSYVPVFLVGSCKTDSEPYLLTQAWEITIDNTFGSCGYFPHPSTKQLALDSLKTYCMVAECSLTHHVLGGGLLNKRTYDMNDELATMAQSWADRTEGEKNLDEVNSTDSELRNLVVRDPEAGYLHSLLDILPEEYYSEFTLWRNTIFAIAGTNYEYKLLAVWFSQKCPDKWLSGGKQKLDEFWDFAIKSTEPNRLTHKSIVYWARQSNPEGYERVTSKSFYNVLYKDVIEFGGKLQEFKIAKILHMLLKQKYCTDLVKTATSEKYVWYEFVAPAAGNLPGENWKWRVEHHPCNLSKYISENLLTLVNKVRADLEQQSLLAAENDAEEGNDKPKSKKGGLHDILKKSMQDLNKTTYKNGIITQARDIFRVRGFTDKLDKMPNLFGVANGVLNVGRTIEFIDYYHEYPISMFTNVNYKKFDPKDPMTKKALQMIENIILEPDARDWILFHAAQALHGGAKEGIILFWVGGGQNGKTSFLRAIAKALGPYADKFNVQILSSDREEANQANSAMMKFKRCNYAYAEETNKSERLNEARLKEIVNAGEVTARELNSRQETFTMHANLVVASQYSLSVGSNDHGLWRRIAWYSSKIKFLLNPDPSNPYEKQDDGAFVQSLPDDPEYQSAILSILTHYYERLQREYGGCLKKVFAPTIQKGTEEFRKEQDVLHRWIGQTFVVCSHESSEIIYPLDELSRYYCEWYNRNIDNRKPSAIEVINDIKLSVLGKFIKPNDSGNMVLVGCRILIGSEIPAAGEERILSHLIRGDKSAKEWAEHCAKASKPSASAEWYL